ncbi:MAG: glycoside hydrolase [Actinobacteria bacterium]|nr:glycoside hydrolase [Actinomycetota bacterium]MCG2820070.1 glycoside hydrolase [Actinomycetes bacterium]MBU4219477.1 glycoside hydrolase [Actinomycetota bacterium]MBU4357906.1 glycoside hydrolase [Actinomycetota bacterium]MBU4393316.1 glycoside hydrolase [Actinomycetota bacterium]
MIGVASRRTTLISLALAVAIALSLVLAAGGQQARAYPDGWTVQSKFGPDTGTISSVSMDAWADHVWVAWRGGPSEHAIGVQTSTDKGATWSIPFYLEDGTVSTDEPFVIQGTNRGDGTPRVHVIYSSKRDTVRYNTWIARSEDYGATWNDYAARWHTADTTCDRLNHKADRFPGSNNVGWICERSVGASYIWETFYGGRIKSDGTVQYYGKMVSPEDGLHSYEPDIACHGFDEAVVVWTNEGGGGYWRANIRYQYTNDYGLNWGLYDGGASSIVGYHPDYRHSNPCIDWDTNNPVLVCSLEDPDGGTDQWRVNRYYFVFGTDEWRPTDVELANLFDTETVRPYPHVYGPMNYEHMFYRRPTGYLGYGDNDRAEINNTFLGAKTILGSMNAISCPGQHADRCVAALTQDGEGHFRRQDNVPPPTAAITKPDPGEGTLYFNSDFEVNATAIDDFVKTAAELATGSEIHSGIASVAYKYSENGSTWTDLPTTGGGSVSYAPPYTKTAKAADLDQKRFKIKMIATDSAGNTSETETNGSVAVDTKMPDTTIAVSGKAGDNGFYVSHPSVTITSSDPNVDKIEYRLTDNFNGAASGNWTTYGKPFTLNDGIWEVEYYSEDKAGNVEAAKKQMVKVDTIAPACAIERPDRDFIEIGFEDDQEYRLTGSSTDSNGVARAAFRINGDEVYGTKTNFNMAYVWQLPTLEDAGTYEIAIVAKDMAGNVGSTSKNVVLDNFCKDWFFAEGNTLPNFDEYICLQNPGDNNADVVIGFHLETGEVIVKNFSLPAHSRQTVVVKDHVPEGNHVSAHVHCDSQAIVAERPMYFNYRDKWAGGHNEKGINAPQKNWYFAEGTTRKNASDGEFEQWLCLQNPTDATATVKITYMTGTGDNIIKHYQVGPHSRKTVDVYLDVGLDQDVSTMIESDTGICAERPQYSNYHRFAPGGHVVSGVSSPLSEWYFAEGSTRQGFQEWLTIQNPNTVEANISIRYMTGGEAGSETGQVITTSRVVAPRSRDTVKVADDVGDNRDVSIELESDVPVVAERPMYFSYGEGAWTGGHDVMGVSRAATEYYMAEGTTRDGYDTWFTIQNPGDHVTNVQIDLMYPDGKVQTRTLYVNPHTRVTLSVDDMVDGPCDVAATIKAGSPIVVERPMYFNYHGWTGGHNTSGYGID